MASLSLAIDIGTDQPMEWLIRCALLGARLSEAMNLSNDERRRAYYLSHCCHVGCTAASHTDADLFGNELTVAGSLGSCQWAQRLITMHILKDPQFDPDLARLGVIKVICSYPYHCSLQRAPMGCIQATRILNGLTRVPLIYG